MQRTVDQHLSELLQGIAPLAPFELSLLDARGCRLAADIAAPTALPAFSSSTCEGYAVLTSDLASATEAHPVRLLVVDEVRPGFRPRRAVVPGAAVLVHLGSALPEGTEAVVHAGDVELDGDSVVFTEPAQPGEHMRLAGVEMGRGATVLPKGARVDARRMSLLAATGVGGVLAHPRPRVVIVTVGDELVEPGASIHPGVVADSNGVMLSGLVQQLGAVAFRVGPVPDDAEKLQQVLADQLVRADLMIVVGGISASSYQTISDVANELGSMEIHRVSMLPGVAQGFGHLGEDRIPVMTLPGYPAAAYVSFEVFVRPVLLRMAGADALESAALRAQLVTGLRSPAGRRQFVPSLRVPGEDGVLRVQPLHSEHITSDLALADCLIVVPDAVEQLMAGDFVDLIPLDVA